MKYRIDGVIKRLHSKVREVFTIKKVKRIFIMTIERFLVFRQIRETHFWVSALLVSSVRGFMDYVK